MDDIPALVEEFFTASATGEATKDKFRPLLPISIGFLLSTGIKLGDIPNAEQMKQLDDYLQTKPNKMGKSYSASTIGDWKRITNDFFSYRLNRKGAEQMTIPETQDTAIIPAENSEKQPQQQHYETPKGDETISYPADPVRAGDSSEPDAPADTEPEKRKPGRPTKGNEERDKKITVNIPTSIFNDIKDMANIDNVTFPDCVNTILENAVNNRWEDIQAIRALRARRH